jgi:hypothetical protein
MKVTGGGDGFSSRIPKRKSTSAWWIYFPLEAFFGWVKRIWRGPGEGLKMAGNETPRSAQMPVL